MQQKWIFASLFNGEYYPEQILDNIQIEGLEYQDVASSEYQLWQWPSGDVYNIRTVSGKESKSFKLPIYSDHDGSPWAVFHDNEIEKVSSFINEKV